jgi:hypothetical protein
LLRIRLDKAEQEIHVLGIRLGKGEYNTKVTKILHLPPPVPGPKLETVPMISELKTKIEQLEARIQLLLGEAEDAKKSRERLLQVYAEITQEFKTMVLNVTGVTLEKTKNKRFILRFSYLPQDTFTFKLDKGHMSFLEQESKLESESAQRLVAAMQESPLPQVFARGALT